MISPIWKSYFYFSSKEIKGIIALGIILLGSVLFSMLFPKSNTFINSAVNKHAIKLFYFNPNTIDSLQAIGIGIPERQVKSLLHYRAKGGYFKNAMDFAKLYGLSPTLFATLSPFIKIDASPLHTSIESYKYKNFKQGEELIWKLDLNKANENEWIQKTKLPINTIRGILKYKNYIGAFTSKFQLSKVYGLPDTIFQQLLPHLIVLKDSNVLPNANALNFNDWKKIGIFTDRQIWMILKLKRLNGGVVSYAQLVEACDLSQAEALMLKHAINLSD